MSRFKYMGIASKWRFFLFVVLMVEYLLNICIYLQAVVLDLFVNSITS